MNQVIDVVTGYPCVEWMGWFNIMQKEAWIKLALVQQLMFITLAFFYLQHVSLCFVYTNCSSNEKYRPTYILKNNLLVFIYKEKEKSRKKHHE